MLGFLDDQAIAEMTGLTLEELQSLRSSLFLKITIATGDDLIPNRKM